MFTVYPVEGMSEGDHKKTMNELGMFLKYKIILGIIFLLSKIHYSFIYLTHFDIILILGIAPIRKYKLFQKCKSFKIYFTFI